MKWILSCAVACCLMLTSAQLFAGGCAATETQISILIDASSSRHPAEIEWEILVARDSSFVIGRVCADYADGLNSTDFACLENGEDYIFNAYDDWGDGWNGGTWQVRRTISQTLIATGQGTNFVNDGDFLSQCANQVLEEQVIFSTNSVVNPIEGCVDSNSINYDPMANVDDGSCLYSGCLDPFANNYDPSVDVNDVNKCEYDVPLNEDCSDAVALSCGDTVVGILTPASAEPSLPHCGLDSLPDPGVWFSFVGTGDQMNVHNRGSQFDTRLVVYQGSCGVLTCIEGVNNNDGFYEIVSFHSQTNTLYYAYLTGPGSGTRQYQVFLTCDTPLVNDLCPAAIPVQCGDVINGSTAEASSTGQPLSNCGTNPQAAGVWYSLVGNGSDITLSLCNSSYDTKINVYDASGGCDTATLSGNCIGGNDDACGVQSEFTFTSDSLRNYLILVNGWKSPTGFEMKGDFELTVSCLGTCDAPEDLSSDNVSESSATLSWTCEPVDHYVLRGNVVGGNGFITQTLNGNCPSPLTINNLTPGTCYFWQVMAVCDANGIESDWSQPDTFCTQCPSPDPIWSNNVTSNSARLNWTQPAGVEDFVLSGGPVGGSVLSFAISNTSRINVSNLSPNTTYQWQISSVCGGDTSDASVTDVFTTNPAKMPGESSSGEWKIADQFSLFPNPAASEVNLSYSNTPDRVTIYTAIGREMMQVRPDKGVQPELSISLQGLSSGLYLVRCYWGDAAQTQRLIVK